NDTNFEYIGRAFYSDNDFWKCYWSRDFFEGIPPENYYIKVLIIDKSGNYLTEVAEVKLFDYTIVNLISDLAFGDIVKYDSKLSSNVNNFTGVIEGLGEGSQNIWDVVIQYYNPHSASWIDLETRTAKIVANGSYGRYSITWDINKDADFKDFMTNITYDFLPIQIAPTAGDTVWGSWGRFGQIGAQPVLITKSDNNNVKILVYEFNITTGWQIDFSYELDSIEGQIFKIFDLNNDNISEILRISPLKIDVLYYTWDSGWLLRSSTLEYDCFSFDIIYDENKGRAFFIANIQDSGGSLYLGKYYFDAGFNLIEASEPARCPSHFIPTSIRIVENIADNPGWSVIIAGIMENSFYSQIIQYDFNFNYIQIVKDAILGKVSAIEHTIIEGADSLILALSRLEIGRMDAVVTLIYDSDSNTWMRRDIPNIDDIKLKILDILAINNDNLDKLITASNTGLFETKIKYCTDRSTILSPICFATETYSKAEISSIINPDNTPIQSVNKIIYKVNNKWFELKSDTDYSYSKFEIFINTDHSNWEALKISYSFNSYFAREKTSIDPSFNVYSSTSGINGLSVFSKFFDDSRFPLLYLNPSCTSVNPYADWRTFNALSGINYRYVPFISRSGTMLGTTFSYPDARVGWELAGGSEYVPLMPILDNSLIHYGPSGYDSGILSQYLNGKDDVLGERGFDGEFNGNYVDNVYLSNPAISEQYDFGKMYYSGIHNSHNSSGVYNYYEKDGVQRVLVKNKLTGFNVFSPANDTAIFQSGELPGQREVKYELNLTDGVWTSNLDGKMLKFSSYPSNDATVHNHEHWKDKECPVNALPVYPSFEPAEPTKKAMAIWDNSSIAYAYIKCETDNIPYFTDKSVKNSELRIYVSYRWANGRDIIGLYKTGDFDEYSLTWENKPPIRSKISEISLSSSDIFKTFDLGPIEDYSPYFLLKHEASSQSTDSLIYIRSKEYSVEELRPIIT
ncbi:MAG: hypothetical protein ACTSQ8_24925, partial [Candidatus Helarchaeota archaeon]